jgi:transcriptional regulator with XRE-family HTH domain
MQLTLREARDLKGWSQYELARKLGVSRSTLMRLESGETEPLHKTVVALERAFGFKPGTLIFGVETVSR